MLRTGASRSLLRSVTSAVRPLARTTHNGAFTGPSAALGLKRPGALALSAYKQASISLQRPATTAATTAYRIDHEAEKKYGERLFADEQAEEVTTDSSVRHVFEEPQSDVEKDTDMLAGVKADLVTIKETFSLQAVPREALYIGLAGVLPYLATSMTTFYLAWDINFAHATGQGFLLSGATAEALLHIIEPLQVGYGAVILSFLGAIHWGLEFAKYGGQHHGYKRYMIGVFAPAVAWPTILLPVEYALTTQFLAFVFLYFADARTTVRGWAPAWYSTYRFVLTFIVGASLVVSLIGRGEIMDKIGHQPGPAEKLQALRDSQMENLEREEQERRAKLAAADEEEEEGVEGEGEEGGDDEGDE
ncbi:MAG: hypothetical protein M1832_003309 [Thelocarpon impressellum]|nr:MAG: hypothetical protein M1832_003309 [Thelocarpon impressellum]